MISSPIQLVVFDMAGTTVRDQSEVEQCFHQAAEDTQLPASRARIKAMQGLPKLEVVQQLWASAIGQDHPDYSAKVQHTYTHFKQVLENHYRQHEVAPTIGALETIQWLREQGIKVALTTGFYRQVADIILDRLGWLKGLDENRLACSSAAIIDLSLTPDETGKGRPHPDMIQQAMRIFGITDPLRVVKIGDTPVDLQAGHAAGVALNLAVTNGTHSKEQLEIHPHHALLTSVGELKELLLLNKEKAATHED